MKPIISLHSVAYTYKHRRHASVSNISLEIFPGEFVLLTGPTGCGKSTLLKMFNGLIPHGSGGIMSGQVRIDGRNTLEYGIAELSQTVGMVFQSPEDQIFSTTVFDETAFILENMGMNPAEITLRVQETLKLVGMFEHRDASIHALSGGQKQRLAVASVLAARPAILALDEPISQLDPQGAAELLTVLQHVNRELGMTIVIVEHRLHEVMPLCRRVMIMDQGMLVWQGTREEAFQCPERFDTYGLRLPQTVDICRHLAVIAPSSRVDHAVTAIQEKYQVPQEIDRDVQPGNARVADCTPVVTVDQLSFYYDKARPPVLADLHLTIPKGQFVALMGNNGAGKSTLLHLIGGLLQADKGSVQVLGQRVRSVMPSVGMVLQNPDFMLFNNTVAEEISFVLRQKEKQAVWPDECKKLVQQLGLTGREDDFPLALSRGQRLRVAIAAVLAARPAVLLLDEPTTGQDIGHIEDIVMLLKSFTAQGGAVVFCTHDAEVAARFADRIVVLSGGQLMADGPASTVFTEQAVLQTAGLKPPAALLVARELYGGKAVTVKEVVSYVRQKCLGSNAGEHAASSSGCPYKANHSD